MVFDHLVKHNGIWYKAGTDVPVNADTVVVKAEKKAEPETVVAETNADTSPYNRAIINTMRVSDLRKVGAEIGIEKSDSMNGNKLRHEILEKLGL